MRALKLSNYLPLFTIFAIHCHQFSRQKYATSTIKYNKILPYFVSMEITETKLSGTLLHRNQNSKLKVGRSMVEHETMVAASTLVVGRGEKRTEKGFHKGNQPFATAFHTPESQKLEYLLYPQNNQATKIMLCIPLLSSRPVISGVYFDATSSLQALMALVCCHCFSQQCIVHIFLSQVHYAYKCLFI